MTEPLLKEINLSILSGGRTTQRMKKLFDVKFEMLRSTIEQLDESNNVIRSNVIFWSLNSMKTEFDIKRLEEYKNVMVEYIEEEKLMENLILRVPQEEVEMENENEKIDQINILLSLTHTFLFTMNGFIVQPSNPGYLQKLNASPFLTGFILGMTPLAAVVSTFGYSELVNKGYKKSYVISLGCLIFGNFLYAFADYLSSVLIMALGRMFVGLGGARVVNRRYLIEQVPKRLIMHYSLMYVTMICLGMAAGPGAALILFNVPEYLFHNVKFDAFTNPGWLCMILWIFFSFILLFTFKDHANNCKKSIIHADIENDYDDNKNKRSSHRSSMVQKDIEALINDENDKFSYLSITFALLSFILFTSRVKLKN
jgi:hypothetical protein